MENFQKLQYVQILHKLLTTEKPASINSILLPPLLPLDSPVTKSLFATVQNKMHYAIHGNTAAEVIMARADHTDFYLTTILC